MKRLTRKILVLMAVLFIGSTASKAYDFEVDGIYYYINSYSKTVQVTSPGSDNEEYSGDIVIPEKITYNGTTYPVTGIFGYAFCNASDVTSVSIPQTVTDIEINAFLGCQSLKSITIPKSVKTIGPEAFEGCRNLVKIEFEEGPDDLVFEKHSNAYVSENFEDSPIQIVILGRNLVSEDFTTPFGRVESNNLHTLVIRNIDAIQRDSYRGLESTSRVIVPTEEDISKVKSFLIGTIYPNFAYIPIIKQNYLRGVEFSLWDNIYNEKKGKTITDIIVDGKSLTPNDGKYFIDGLKPDSTYQIEICYEYNKPMSIITKYAIKDFPIQIKPMEQDTIRSKFCTLVPKFDLTDLNITQTTYKTQVLASEDKTLSPSEKGVYLRTYYSQEEWVKYKADSVGTVLATGLVPNEIYCIRPYAVYNGKEYTEFQQYESAYENITTKPIKPFTNKKSPYSVNHIDLSVSSGTLDSDLSVVELGVRLFYSGTDYPANSDKTVTIGNLTPGQYITIYPYVVVKYASTGETKKVIGEAQTYTSSTPYIKDIDCVASTTTIKVNEMEYELYDGTFKECGFSTPYAVIGNKAFFTGLNPGEKYDITGYLIVEEGNYKATLSRSVTTPALILTTLPAKATSNTKAVICAETNIANEETGTGFEFRRIDAPDLVPSTVVYCAVHDGVMEGILNNLSSNTYYKYRPFYKSASGKMYYGEWIGFGTADAYVYFTPTVHTYATAGVENNSVTLNGYALAGSDDILEQGFEYWTDGITRAAANGVQTVTATGQRMTITLNDLQYNTTYRYRAYVKTAKETTYGEEMTFTTGAAPSGIGEVATEELDVEVRTLSGGSLELRLSGAETTTARYALYTPNGVSVVVGELTSVGEWQPIGDSSLSQGLYLLRVENNKLCRTVKVMVK